jgi:UV excision repair protein RAD23
LKQQKFVIEAEPSELVRISILTFPTSLFRLATLGHATPYSKKIAKEKGWEAAQQKLIYSGLFCR